MANDTAFETSPIKVDNLSELSIMIQTKLPPTREAVMFCSVSQMAIAILLILL